mgnify:CR=1 FL=1
MCVKANSAHAVWTVDLVRAVAGLLIASAAFPAASAAEDLDAAARQCVNCHTKNSPAIVADWEASRHAEVGRPGDDAQRQ